MQHAEPLPLGTTVKMERRLPRTNAASMCDQSPGLSVDDQNRDQTGDGGGNNPGNVQT